ncbi:MAG: hypothetical protein IJ684_01295 [Bacteroidales bacterium]|nr:hypothetical protein [Bacteroidales bacterium]
MKRRTPTSTSQVRSTFAWILLSVFVPMLLLSSLHRHAVRGEAECAACVQHLPHAGHFSQAASVVDDCLLCQFLSLPYVPAQAAVLAVFPLFSALLPRRTQATRLQSWTGCICLRGPPTDDFSY